MRNFSIPQLIPADGFSARQKLLLILALLLALLLHLSFYLGAAFVGLNPFSLIFPEDKPQFDNKDAMQFVLIDDKQLDEQIPDELKPKMRGRINQVSRDNLIKPDLPKTGPSGKADSPIGAFKEGAPVPTAAGAHPRPPQPASPPTPAPQPPVKPVKPVTPQPSVTTRQPVKDITPAENTQEISKILQNSAPELDTKLDIPGILPEAINTPKKPNQKPHKSDFEKKQDAKRILENPEIAKIKPEDMNKAVEKAQQQDKSTKKRPQTNPRQPVPPRKAQKQVPRAKPPTRKIPTRRIGQTPRSLGGKMNRSRSSAMLPGIKSMAVLKDRYGEYMDLVLKRIQQAILIQQQISPIMFQHGAVIMTFSINEKGKLGNIKFIKALPDNLDAETAAARRVLDDVSSGKPFPPPSSKMLADPDFQKITINFLFEVQ